MMIPKEIEILAFTKNEQAGILAAKEVERIGRTPCIFWNIVSAWDSVCLNTISKKSPYMSKVGPFSCLRGHYHIMQKACDMGWESVWVCEDDVRFLKDISIVNEMLSNAPKDADILLLDYLVWSDSMDEKHNQNEGWWKVANEDLRGAGDYIMNRRAMEKYVDVLTRGIRGYEMTAVDVGRNNRMFSGFNIYAANPNLSIQQKDEEYCHMSGSVIHDKYVRNNSLEIKKYQEW